MDILYTIKVKFSSCSLIGSCTLNDTLLPEFEVSPTIINGVVVPDCPDSFCLASP